MFGAFALLAFLAALGGTMHEGYSKSELFVIFCSLAVSLYYLSQIFDWRKNAGNEIAQPWLRPPFVTFCKYSFRVFRLFLSCFGLRIAT
jgi:hypothetical protein